MPSKNKNKEKKNGEEEAAGMALCESYLFAVVFCITNFIV